MELQSVLKGYITSHGITQAHIARLINCGTDRICRWLKGQRKITETQERLIEQYLLQRV